MTIRNHRAWLEITDTGMFCEGDNPRSTKAWKHLEALQSSGRLTTSDIILLEALLVEATRYGQHFENEQGYSYD